MGGGGGVSSAVEQDAETAEAVRMFGMYFVSDAHFSVCKDCWSCSLSTYVLVCERVGSCVKATTEWMTIGGQCFTAAEWHVLSYSQVHVSGCVGVRVYVFLLMAHYHSLSVLWNATLAF